MELKITRVGKTTPTKFGNFKTGIQTEQYPDTWINGFVKYELQPGAVINAEVTDDPKYGKQFKIISTVKPASIASKVVAAYKQVDQEEKWDKISWGKCKHAYLVEVFKETFGGESTKSPEWYEWVEKEAERWADMSMRKLSDMEPAGDKPASGYNDDIPNFDNIPFD